MLHFRLAAVVALLVLPAVAVPGRTADIPPPAPAPVFVVPDLSGCWSGCWFSCKNGHKGPLKAEFCKLSETCYQVTFRGRFWVVLPFRYTTTMTVTGYTADGQVLLASSQRLGPILGTFCMNAVASTCRFEANFESRNDHGKFVLSRN